jgi:hypothetical protein
MNGRRSQYRGGHSGAPVGNSKGTHKGDKVDKGKGINEDMCMTDKDNTFNAHLRTYDRYDTWRNNSSTEPCTPEDQINPFSSHDSQKQAKFEAGLESERLKIQYEYDQNIQNKTRVSIGMLITL